MSKLVRGPVLFITFQETAHLSLSEQFQTIQNHARLEATAENPENPVQTITLSEILSSDIMPKIHLSLQGFTSYVTQNQQSKAQSVASALQILLESPLTEDQEPNKESANSATIPKAKQPEWKITAYAEIQNPLCKIDQLQYLDA